MPNLYQSAWAKSQRTTPTSGCGADELAQLFEYTLTATALGVGDIIELGVLPANNAPCDAILVCDDLDTNGTPTIVMDVGIMNGDVGALLDSAGSFRTCGAELFSASVAAKTGVTERASLLAAFTIAPSDKDRSIGVKITTAAATQAAAGQKVRLMLKYRAV